MEATLRLCVVRKLHALINACPGSADRYRLALLALGVEEALVALGGAVEGRR